MLRSPKGPTKAEWDEHMATHCPYREWCPHCVRGKAIRRQHRVKTGSTEEDEEARKIPLVGMDFWYMTDEDRESGKNAHIMLVERNEGHHIAFAVGTKHAQDWWIKLLADEMEAWGLAKVHVVMKCDNEPAIRCVRQKLTGFRQDTLTVPEDPLRGSTRPWASWNAGYDK